MAKVTLSKKSGYDYIYVDHSDDIEALTIKCPFCGSVDVQQDPDGDEDTYGCLKCHKVFALDDGSVPPEPENDQTDNLTVVDGKHVGRRKEG